MVDIFTKEKRSEVMRSIKSKDTRPEMIVRKFIYAQGFRYRLHQKSLIGKPDIVLKYLKTVINIHGCFWHGHKNCKFYKMPKSNIAYWKQKISNNILRDKIAQKTLRKEGWNIITIWECSLKPSKRTRTLSLLLKKLEKYKAEK